VGGWNAGRKDGKGSGGGVQAPGLYRGLGVINPGPAPLRPNMFSYLLLCIITVSYYSGRKGRESQDEGERDRHGEV